MGNTSHSMIKRKQGEMDIGNQSDQAIQELIREALLSHPFFQDISSDNLEEKYLTALYEMRNVGYRPVTPQEYRLQVNRLKEGKGKAIFLWVKLEEEKDFIPEEKLHLNTLDFNQVLPSLSDASISPASTNSLTNISNITTEEWIIADHIYHNQSTKSHVC